LHRVHGQGAHGVYAKLVDIWHDCPRYHCIRGLAVPRRRDEKQAISARKRIAAPVPGRFFGERRHRRVTPIGRVGCWMTGIRKQAVLF
jgi:hypothetical protein